MTPNPPQHSTKPPPLPNPSSNPPIIPATLTVIPATLTVIPAILTVIPATLTVIPAKAGIHLPPILRHPVGATGRSPVPLFPLSFWERVGVRALPLQPTQNGGLNPSFPSPNSGSRSFNTSKTSS